jgi:WD40 repeat protein
MRIFSSPDSMRAGGFWKPQLAAEIEKSTAFILLIGEKGLGDWQVMEYFEALDRRAKEPDYPIILILSAKRPAPGLPFARQLHWVLTEDPTSEATIGSLLDAASGPAQRPGELWRFTRPYRGLESMTEANSDYFFGRDRKTVEVVDALASAPEKLPILLGNSGVGKSSLAQAGVLSALLRQGWSDKIKDVASWPDAFQDSRRWCFLTLRPGTQPLQALVALFFDTWQYAAASAERVKEEKGWIELLREGKAALPDLLDATARRYRELAQTAPSAFLLYIDQGEELYVRAEERESRRFSEILAHGLGDARLRALMSMRSDFLGQLQRDEALFEAHRKIDVPPLREPDLREVVNRPAELLNARFENEGLAAHIAHGTAEESAKDAGALPLLSYLLDDMWTQMVERGDGTLRLPSAVFDLGGVLVRRANAFVSRHPHSEDVLRRIFTLKLATVREDGDPTRRLALRSEFSDEEWRLVSDLADHPNRLLVTATPEGGETYAEVAHEAIFRRWDKLREWIAAERDFLVWRSSLEAARRTWQATPQASKSDALLMGLALAQAQACIVQRAEDVPKVDREFIDQSLEREVLERRQRERLRRRISQIAAAALVLLAALGAFAGLQWFEATKQRNDALVAQSRFLTRDSREATKSGNATLGALLALAALPKRLADPDRPFINEAEFALEDSYANRRERLILHGHTDNVRNAVFSADGQRLLTAADDGARLWDLSSGKEIKVLHGGGALFSAAFSPDGQRVLTAGWDGAARLWDLDSGKEIMALRAHDPSEGDWVGHILRGAAFSPDGRRVVTASADKTARVWDLSTGKEIVVLRHEALVKSAAFSSDGQRVVTASSDKTARLWDVGSGKDIMVLRHDTDISSAAFSPDGQRVLTAGWDGTARLWDLDSGKEIMALRGGSSLYSAAFSPDGQQVVTASSDKTARLWDLSTSKQFMVLGGHDSSVLNAAFSPDGERLATTSFDDTARVWDVSSRNKIIPLNGYTGGLRFAGATFSPDGQYIAIQRSGEARLWELSSGKEIMVLPAWGKVAFSPDGQRVVAESGRNTAGVWEVASGKEIIVLRGHDDHVWSAAFSPDGRRVVTASADKTARVWDANSGKEVMVLRGHTDMVISAAFSPDGQRVITSSFDKQPRVRVWDVDSGKEIVVLQGDYYHADIALFSPDGQRALMASSGAVSVWDLGTGERIARLSGHEDDVRSVAFSPDHRRMVTASTGGTARVWDLRTWKEIMVLRAKGQVLAAAFSPDGRRIVTASNDVRVWNLPPRCQVLTDAAEKYLDDMKRELSAAERARSFLADKRTDVPDFLSRKFQSILAIVLPAAGERCE